MFVSVALVSLYTIVLPIITLVLFKEFDAVHYNQLKGYYEQYTASLPSVSFLTLPEPVTPKIVSTEFSIREFVSKIYYNSAVHSIYTKLSTNEKILQWSKPVYHQYLVPVISKLEEIKSDIIIWIAPYYAAGMKAVLPRYEMVKASYILYYHQFLDTVAPYVVPHYKLYGEPHFQNLVGFYHSTIYPFYLENQEKADLFGSFLVNFTIGVIVFFLLEDKIKSVLRLVFHDIYDIDQGLKNNYKTDVPDDVKNRPLIDPVSDDVAKSLLKTAKEIDQMRPLDNIVDHESDFTDIRNSSSSTFGDSTTIVGDQARHPYSQKENQKSTKKAGKSKKGKQVKKDLNGSFLDKSLAIGVLGQNDKAHMCAQVQVQVINENGNVEIQEEIEDELAGKGKPVETTTPSSTLSRSDNKIKSNDERIDIDQENDEADTQDTEEFIRNKLNSVSDSSSEESQTRQAKIPRILTDFSTPKKYNTGLFYSTTRQGLVTAAIPLTPSPTKAAFGILLDDDRHSIKSVTNSIISESSLISPTDNSFLSFDAGGSLMSTAFPSKPATASVTEETVYCLTAEAEKTEVNRRKSMDVLGKLSSDSSSYVQMRD